MRETIVTIEGMSCQHCVMQVKKALGTIGGIKEMDVSIGTATVHYDESKVGKEDIEAAIVAAGYEVKGITP